jgi:hypothetical protein
MQIVLMHLRIRNELEMLEGHWALRLPFDH